MVRINRVLFILTVVGCFFLFFVRFGIFLWKYFTGPMDSYHVTNPYVDYKEDTAALFLDGNKIKEEILLKIKAKETKLSQEIERVIPLFTATSDYSIYTGYCGIAYLYLRKYESTKFLPLLTKAHQLVGRALDALKNKRISFLNGDAGPLALGIVILKYLNEDKDCDELINRLVTLNDSEAPNELLYGQAGYLYALAFVDTHIGPVIPVVKLRAMIETILKSGRRRAKAIKSEIPLHFMWHDKNYLGAAHGVAGILYVLLSVHHALTDYEKNELIKPTLEWLRTMRFVTGNFMSSEGSERDRLVQWCHGAPGFVHLYLLASQVYKEANYLRVALECAEVIWERGILSKGYSICHGVSGNAYSFLAIYKFTKEPKYLYRAVCFADWCTRYPSEEGLRPDRPYSLFEGMAGIDYFLFDIQDPLNSIFPAFEFKYT